MKPFVVVLVTLLSAIAPASAKVKKPLSREHDRAPAAQVASFDADEATRQIRARMGVVRACYQRASRFDPGLRGKLQLGFDVADSGQVSATQIEVDGLRVDADPAVAVTLTSCIRTQAQNWRLSPEGPTGGAHFSYVFVFEAAH